MTTTPDPTLAPAVEALLARAAQAGADQAQVTARSGRGLAVTVRLAKAERIEHRQDRSLALTVYLRGMAGMRTATCATTDLSPAALRETACQAVALARLADDDPAAGLPDEATLEGAPPDLALSYPIVLDPQPLLAEAAACEAAALAVDPRICNSEGATVSATTAAVVLGNSLGQLVGYPTSRKAVGCVVVAEQGGAKERDGWSASAHAPAAVESPTAIGRIAGERTARRLGGRQLTTRKAPVCFEHDAAATLLGHLAGALSGTALYRRSTFLSGWLGAPLFPPFVTVRDEGRLPSGLGSAPFDDDGVATQDRSLIDGGVVAGYLLDTYAGRKLGLASTGNGGGFHNLYLRPGDNDLAGLLRQMGTGLLVTDLMGQGVNLITGDYSRGAAGFWVEGGELAFPVHEITVAAHLRDLFGAVVAVGSDLRFAAPCTSPSLLIEEMTIAGA